MKSTSCFKDRNRAASPEATRSARPRRRLRPPAIGSNWTTKARWVFKGHRSAGVDDASDVADGRARLDGAWVWGPPGRARRRSWRATWGQATDLYRGGFLDDRERALPQATAVADGLRRRLLRQILRVARQCEEANAQEAIDWYEEGLRMDPCAEEVYRSLMNVHRRLGHPAEVGKVYVRCEAALSTHLGRTPSPETRALLTPADSRRSV